MQYSRMLCKGPLLRAPALARLLRSCGTDPSLGVRAFGFGSHMSENDPEIIEREKQRALKGRTHGPIPGMEQWNEKLASDSEAVVKAERECPDCSVYELQKRSVKSLHEEDLQDEEDRRERKAV